MNIALYTDGSCPRNWDPGPNNPAGWAFVVVNRNDIFKHQEHGQTERLSCSGRVITKDPQRGWIGARTGTNQTAELCGVYWALRYVQWNRAEGAPLDSVALFTDSKYAKFMVTREWKWDDNCEMENKELVLACRKLQDDVDVRIRWLPGHRGFHWNEKADELAYEAAKLGKYVGTNEWRKML